MIQVPQKTFLITGAAGKIGRNLTEALLALGHIVVAASRNPERLGDHPEYGRRLLPFRSDLTDGGVHQSLEELQRQGIRPNGLVNNAVDIVNQRLDDENGIPSRQQWIREFELAVMAPFELAMGLALTPQSKLETVVNVSSMYGVVARNLHLYDRPLTEGPIHYGVAKAAMLHLTRELAVRLIKSGIRVNAVSFGGVEGRANEAFKVRYANLCPEGRMLEEPEVVGSILFLLSENAKGIVGHNLIVDGGWTVW